MAASDTATQTQTRTQAGRATAAGVAQGVADHYGRGSLLDRITAGLDRLGLPREGVTLAALAAVDELHTGGLPATLTLLDQLDIPAGARVLDVGCGIGGPARHIAARTGADVTGIDLTPDFIATGRALTAWCGLADRVTLVEGNALAMPFPDASFDVATQLHVGMNIPDKAGLAAELARVLKPGGVLAVYDMMRVGEGEVSFPMPWASHDGISAVATPAEYRDALTAAGFAVTRETSRRDGALDWFADVAAKTAAAGGPPPLGVHLVMGPEAPVMVANLIAAMRAGVFAPVEILARRN